MRYVTLGAMVCCLLIGGTVRAQTPNPQMMAPIQKFLEAFNKGDIAGAAATHATGADVVIIDELSPYIWRGASAFQDWVTALDGDSKQRGITEPHVALSAPTRIETDGTGAYVVAPAAYTFKEKGVAMREASQMTFVLKKDANGWMIHGWTWTGSKPHKAAASAPTPSK
jgi:ketosteroid isomerase-like protein